IASTHSLAGLRYQRTMECAAARSAGSAEAAAPCPRASRIATHSRSAIASLCKNCRLFCISFSSDSRNKMRMPIGKLVNLSENCGSLQALEQGTVILRAIAYGFATIFLLMCCAMIFAQEQLPVNYDESKVGS